MQSTGMYWMPVWEILQQRGMEVYPVNGRHTKSLPGRVSDIAECRWLLKLHTFGLLNNSFQPSDAIRATRLACVPPAGTHDTRMCARYQCCRREAITVSEEQPRCQTEPEARSLDHCQRARQQLTARSPSRRRFAIAGTSPHTQVEFELAEHHARILKAQLVGESTALVGGQLKHFAKKPDATGLGTQCSLMT